MALLFSKIGRLFVIFYFLFMMSTLSLAQLEECSSYSDCPPIDCIGYSRSCIIGECHYTDCLISYGMQGREDVQSFASTLEEYHVETENTFGLAPILLLAGKFILIAFLIMLLVFGFSALRLKGFLKILFIFIAITIVVMAFLYSFGGLSPLLKMFGLGGDIDQDNNVILDFSEKKQLKIVQKDMKNHAMAFFGQDITWAKEYKLMDDEGEIIIIIVEDSGKKTLSDYMYENSDGYSKELGWNKAYYLNGLDYNHVYVWKDSDRFYYVSGPKDLSRLISMILLKQNHTLSSGQHNNKIIDYNIQGKSNGLVKEDVVSPKIMNVSPTNDSYSSSNQLYFEIISGENAIDFDSISVQGLDFWGESNNHCSSYGNHISCSMDFCIQEDGWQWFTISAQDLAGNKIKNLFSFFNDQTPPEFRFLPKNNSVMAFFNLEFEVFDDGSGIDKNSIRAESSTKLQFGCNKVGKALNCIISSIDIEEGEHQLVLVAKDNVGHEEMISMTYIYDKTRPEIEISSGSILVTDNYGVDVDTIIVDNKKYNPESCKEISGGLKCPYDSASKVSVSDFAGNNNVIEQKLIRS